MACDSTGLQSSSFGRIDILSSYSFFEADNALAAKIVEKVNGADFEGKTLSVEITKGKSDGSDGAGGGDPKRSSSGGGNRRAASNPRPGGRSSGGFRGSSDSRSGGGDRDRNRSKNRS